MGEEPVDPGGHWVHWEAPEELYVPGAQGVQTLLVWYVPAGQGWQVGDILALPLPIMLEMEVGNELFVTVSYEVANLSSVVILYVVRSIVRKAKFTLSKKSAYESSDAIVIARGHHKAGLALFMTPFKSTTESTCPGLSQDPPIVVTVPVAMSTYRIVGYPINVPPSLNVGSPQSPTSANFPLLETATERG